MKTTVAYLILAAIVVATLAAPYLAQAVYHFV